MRADQCKGLCSITGKPITSKLELSKPSGLVKEKKQRVIKASDIKNYKPGIPLP